MAPTKLVVKARLKLEQVKKKVASVHVACAHTGVKLQVDGRDLWPTPYDGRVYLMPGIHKISATKAAHRTFTWQAGLRAGQHVAVQVKLVPEPKPTQGPTKAVAPKPPPAAMPDEPLPWPAREVPKRATPAAPTSDEGGGKPRRGRLWTYVAAGCAVAALGVGIGLGASVLSEADAHNSMDPSVEQPEDADVVRQRLGDRALGASILFGTAGVLAATSVVLFFLEGRAARKDSRKAGAAVRLVPLVGQAQGVSLSTSF